VRVLADRIGFAFPAPQRDLAFAEKPPIEVSDVRRVAQSCQLTSFLPARNYYHDRNCAKNGAWSNRPNSKI
jgi:hypothetical protein